MVAAVEDALQFRAERSQYEHERDAGLAVGEYLDGIYDSAPEPITKLEGERLGALARGYISWCVDNDLVAIPGSSIWLATYLHELREQGRAESDLHAICKAVSRAHYQHGHLDPTNHPRVKAVLNNLRKEKQVAYKPSEKGADEQSTTPFRVKSTKRDIIDAEDADQKEFMQVKHGTRELTFLDEHDDLTDRRSGGPAALPRVTQ